MLPSLLLKGKRICHVTINEHRSVRESISDEYMGVGEPPGTPRPFHIYHDISSGGGYTWGCRRANSPNASFESDSTLR